MKIPQVLINFIVYEKGTRLGIVDIELPKLEAVAATLKGSGIPGEISVPVMGHYNNLETKLNFRVMDKDVISLADGRSHQLDFRGAIQRQDTGSGELSVDKVKVVLAGMATSSELGKGEVGNTMDSSITMATTYIKITINGETALEIDKLNFICNINGKDLSSEVRSALGL